MEMIDGGGGPTVGIEAGNDVQSETAEAFDEMGAFYSEGILSGCQEMNQAQGEGQPFGLASVNRSNQGERGKQALFGPNYCYRLIPAWDVFFFGLGLIALALLYGEWLWTGGNAATSEA